MLLTCTPSSASVLVFDQAYLPGAAIIIVSSGGDAPWNLGPCRDEGDRSNDPAH